MTVDTDLSTPLEQVRAIIGDTSGTLITDQTINALLLVNSNNVNLTAIQALQFIVADLAKQIRQEVGDVEIYANQQYEQYKDLLDDLLKDPAFMLIPALHILGGVSKSEANRVNDNSDSRRIRIIEGFGTRVNNCIPDINNPFFLDCDDDCL